jgi:hypothetical protein
VCYFHMELVWYGCGVTTRAHTVELAPRSDGARYRRVSLALERGGDLILTSHEMGASLEAAWGLDDAEITLQVAPDQLARLALALVAERLAGGEDAVQALAELCEEHGVDYRTACWT